MRVINASEVICLKILVACEESQRVTIELRQLGHEAYSCDILPCSGGHEEWHLQVDATQLLKIKWDMIIAFPPCTYISNAGARHLFPKGQLNEERFKKGLEAKEFFMQFYNADCERIAIENPVSSTIFKMPKHSQEIQPWQFGHPVTKKTRLWLKGLPFLEPTNIVKPCQTCHNANTWFSIGGKERQKNRSKTFPGIAKAMAEQWAGKIE
nr:MAG TPA: Cytosine specific methyltransferase [Caudoviricetes sp.]